MATVFQRDRQRRALARAEDRVHLWSSAGPHHDQRGELLHEETIAQKLIQAQTEVENLKAKLR